MTDVRALCCECGNLRTVNRRHHRRKDENHSFDDGCHPDGWRMTATLKCPACRRLTRHAYLRDDMPDVRHYAEMRQYGLDLGRDELQRQAFNLMEALSPADLTVQELQQFVLFLRPIYRRASKGTDH